jgi:hypothetical protein
VWAFLLSLLLGGLAGFAIKRVKSKELKITLGIFAALMPAWAYVATAFASGCNLDGTGGGACFGLSFVVLGLFFAAPLWWLGMLAGYFRSSART